MVALREPEHFPEPLGIHQDGIVMNHFSVECGFASDEPHEEPKILVGDVLN